MKMQTEVRQMIQNRIKRIQDIRHLKEVKNVSIDDLPFENKNHCKSVIKVIHIFPVCEEQTEIKSLFPTYPIIISNVQC